MRYPLIIYGIRLLQEIFSMEDIRFHRQLDFKIENVGYVSVQRNENYFFCEGWCVKCTKKKGVSHENTYGSRNP